MCSCRQENKKIWLKIIPPRGGLGLAGGGVMDSRVGGPMTRDRPRLLDPPGGSMSRADFHRLAYFSDISAAATIFSTHRLSPPTTGDNRDNARVNDPPQLGLYWGTFSCFLAYRKTFSKNAIIQFAQNLSFEISKQTCQLSSQSL